MSITTMDDLFVTTLRDVYYAESQILKSMPDMIKKAHGSELQQALENHRRETEGQIERLETIFEQMDMKASGKKCDAIEGIIAEAKEHMSEIEDEDVLDAGLIGAAQAIEHYEISRYGTLIEWAKELGLDDAAELLGETLEQEKNADMLLTEIAKTSTNRRAAA